MVKHTKSYSLMPFVVFVESECYHRPRFYVVIKTQSVFDDGNQRISFFEGAADTGASRIYGLAATFFKLESCSTIKALLLTPLH